jgi:hypothetical protein
MPVHRVSFSGPSLSGTVRAALAKVGIHWQGSMGFPDRDGHHHVLLDSSGAARAEDSVRDALRPFGAFHGFTTRVFEEYGAGDGRRPFVPPGEGPDWSDVATRAELTEAQQEVLECLLNGDEPTWMLEKECTPRFDRAEVELALADLKSRHLVSSTREDAGNGPPGVMDDWWTLTQWAWHLLGLIRSPRR